MTLTLLAAADDGSERRVVASLGLNRLRHLSVMLGMVTIRPGARILELGTDPDFGYATLLLARSARGSKVVSVDESARVTGRAQQALKMWPSQPQISFHTGSVRSGWPRTAPYDLIVSNAQFGWLPHAWLQQCAPGGSSIVMKLAHTDSRPRLYFHTEVNDQRRPINPRVLVEHDPHPHHSHYETAPGVDLHPMDDGYTITTQL